MPRDFHNLLQPEFEKFYSDKFKKEYIEDDNRSGCSKEYYTDIRYQDSFKIGFNYTDGSDVYKCLLYNPDHREVVMECIVDYQGEDFEGKYIMVYDWCCVTSLNAYHNRTPALPLCYSMWWRFCQPDGFDAKVGHVITEDDIIHHFSEPHPKFMPYPEEEDLASWAHRLDTEGDN